MKKRKQWLAMRKKRMASLVKKTIVNVVPLLAGIRDKVRLHYRTIM